MFLKTGINSKLGHRSEVQRHRHSAIQTSYRKQRQGYCKTNQRYTNVRRIYKQSEHGCTNYYVNLNMVLVPTPMLSKCLQLSQTIEFLQSREHSV